MNVEDRQIMSQIEKDIAEIKTALLGSALSGDLGLVGKIADIDRRVRQLELERNQNTNLRKVIVWLASVIGVGFAGLIFKYFEK